MTTARLTKDLARLLDGQLNHDVVIRVGQGADKKEFPAHIGLLRARSPYFDVALSSRWVQADRNEPVIFEKADMSPATFGVVLRYVYTGQIDWEQVDQDPLAMVMTADELLLDELIDLVQDPLIEKRAEWVSENNVHVLNVVVDRDTCSKLRDHALGIISVDADDSKGVITKLAARIPVDNDVEHVNVVFGEPFSSLFDEMILYEIEKLIQKK